MLHIYLSPHLDDAVFSCGALIHQQTSIGKEVIIHTLFAGDGDPNRTLFSRILHARWKIISVEARREEDRQACALLGASFRHAPFPDAIYRSDPRTGKPLYSSSEALFGSPYHREQYLLPSLIHHLRNIIDKDTVLFLPLGIGGHVDHHLAMNAGEALGFPVYYYQDYPYANLPENLRIVEQRNMRKLKISLSPEDIETQVVAMSCYKSQLSSYWKDDQDLRQKLEMYINQQEGLQLWYKMESPLFSL